MLFSHKSQLPSPSLLHSLLRNSLTHRHYALLDGLTEEFMLEYKLGIDINFRKRAEMQSRPIALLAV